MTTMSAAQAHHSHAATATTARAPSDSCAVDPLRGLDADEIVATREILIERRSKFHLSMPAVGSNIAAKRRDLVHDSRIVENTDCPECNSHRNGAGKEISYLLRPGGCGEIPVEMGMPEQCVANSATYAPGFEAGSLEFAGDFKNGFGWRKSRRQSVVPEHVANRIHLHSRAKSEHQIDSRLLSAA